MGLCKGFCEGKGSKGTGGADMCDSWCEGEGKGSEGTGGADMRDSSCEGVGDAAGVHGGRGDAMGGGAYELVDEPVSRKDACCMTRSVGHGSSG